MTNLEALKKEWPLDPVRAEAVACNQVNYSEVRYQIHTLIAELEEAREKIEVLEGDVIFWRDEA